MSNKFFKLPQDMTALKALKPTDKIVFSVIHDHLGNNDYSWPGKRILMRKTGLAGQTVLDCIERLEAAGFLEVNRRGNGRLNHYKTNLQIKPELKAKRSRKLTGLNTGPSGLKDRPQAVQKLDPNQTDLITQPAESKFVFVLKGEKQWHLPPAKLGEYRKAYSGIDIEAELYKSAQWLVDNPAKRKTADGMLRYINGWLGRAKPPQAKKDKPRPFAPQVEEEFLSKMTSPASDEQIAQLEAEGLL
jgi:hypothetical protein